MIQNSRRKTTKSCMSSIPRKMQQLQIRKKMKPKVLKKIVRSRSSAQKWQKSSLRIRQIKVKINKQQIQKLSLNQLW